LKSDVTNSIQLPGKTKTYLKVWNGRGSNEFFLDFVMTSLGLIQHLGHWKKLEEAADAVLEAEELVKATKEAYKDAGRQGEGAARHHII
jgi:nucleoid-associated protein YejK